MQKVNVLVSAISHMPLWAVWRESGLARKNGIDLEFDVAEWSIGGRPAVSMKRRAELLLDGSYQFLSGLHHEPYTYRARGDKRFVYLAQAQNDWDDRFVVVPGITRAEQLEGETVLVSSQAPCVVGNLKQALRIAGVDISTVTFAGGERPRSESFHWVVEALERREAVAAAVDLPFDQVATRRGLTTLDIPRVPVIHNTTICSNREWVKENLDLTRSLLRSMVEAVHFFKTETAEVRRILQTEVAPLLRLEVDEDVDYLQRAWAGLLNAKPYPHPLAIWNVYRLDVANDVATNHIDPLEPWDLSLLREIDDSGFIDDLYGAPARNPAVAAII
jgi:ABC-type nitrate/sulfonate/bicarbonate transport system substrate-binding protein